MTPFTSEQIARLAPDAASLKAANGLTNPGKWPLLHASDQALWGHCQGSGKNPYQTAVDLREPAFKCSCPSRKFPCKHGLALLLLHAQRSELFTPGEAPDWLNSWLEKRSQNQEAKAAKAAKADAAPDPAAQQKRQDARRKKAAAGLADLQLWLDDILRNGLVALRGALRERCRDMARRMIDAQLGGIAAELQAIGELPADAQEQCFYRLSRLNLLAENFARLDELPPEVQAETSARLGFPVAKETVLAGAAIPGLWWHIGTVISEIDRGEAHAHWLYDAASQRFAYILDFIIRGAPTALPSVLHGKVYAGELCYYPGIHNLRVLAKTWEAVAPPPLAPAAHGIAPAIETAQQAYAGNPLLNHYPLRVDNVRLARRDDALALSDGTHALPLALSENDRLRLLASSGGTAFSAFLLYEYETRSLRLLSFSDEAGRLHVY
jgi:protein containing SWIM Zn-chelating domain protein